MSLDVEDIRRRAEEVEQLLRRETLRARAGLRTRPEFDRLFASHPDLGDRELLADVERAMAGAEPEEEQRLRCLLEWVAEHQVERSVASLVDEYFAWEATTTVEVEGMEIPLRQLARVVAQKPDPSRRHALQLRAEEALQDSVSLRMDILERERDAVRDLGYGSYLEARERFGRQSYGPLLERARRVAEATDAVYRRHLRAHLDRHGLEPGTATRGDELAIRRSPFPDADAALPGLGPVRDLVARDLSALDLSLRGSEHLEFDVERRPLKRPESFCAAPEVPGRAVGVVAAIGGWADVYDFLDVAGPALSLAHVDPGLPFEERYLGDPSMGFAYGALFRGLLSRPSWVQRLDLPADRREALALFSAWADLLDFRRDVARLGFEIELWKEREPVSLVREFPDRIEEATGFRPPPQAFLEVVGGGLRVARRVRGRLLAAHLEAELVGRFGEEWHRNPSAGPFLTELFAGGWRRARRRVRSFADEEDRGAAELVSSFRLAGDR